MLKVKVKPNARTSELMVGDDGIWIARLKSPPVDGKANAELIELIAAHFKLRRGAISIKRGASARLKLVCVDA